MILLRKKIEDVLVEKGLGFLHLEKTHSKHLALVGECGQTYFSFKGISVGSKINRAERDYLADLITIYLNEHVEDIKFTIKYKKEGVKLYEKEGLRFNAKNTYNQKTFSVVLKTDDFNINLNQEFKVIYNNDNKSFRIEIAGEEEYIKKHIRKLSSYKKELLKFNESYLKKLETERKINDFQNCKV